MNKIFNWTFGSFFRTIGRTIALLLLGGLFYYILSSNGIGIKDLFFDKVNASTTGISAQWQGDMWNISGTKLNFGTFGFQDQFDATQGGGSQRTVRTFYFNSAINTSGGGLPIQDGKDYISFRYTIWTPLMTSTTNDFAVSFSFWTQNNWGAGANCEVISDSDAYLNNTSKIVKMYIIKCPIINGTSAISNFNVSFNATNNTLYYHELSGDVLSYSSVSVSDQQIINSINTQTQTITDNQNQNTNSIIESQNQTQAVIENESNKTISTITDETSPDMNSTMDNNTLVGYLPAGPLDSVLNLPLSILNNLVSKLAGVCSPLVINLPFLSNSSLSIPCIDTIFANIPGLNLGLSAVFGIISGLMLYNYLLFLYNWVDDVTSLKHGRPRFFGAKSDVENWGAD